MQGDLNLNIAEAHAFNTTDRFTLDVFVVNGWSGAGVEDLEELLSQRLQELPAPGPPRQHSGGLGSSSPPADAQDLPFLIDFDQRKVHIWRCLNPPHRALSTDCRHWHVAQPSALQ